MSPPFKIECLEQCPTCMLHWTFPHKTTPAVLNICKSSIYKDENNSLFANCDQFVGSMVHKRLHVEVTCMLNHCRMKPFAVNGYLSLFTAWLSAVDRKDHIQERDWNQTRLGTPGISGPFVEPEIFCSNVLLQITYFVDVQKNHKISSKICYKVHENAQKSPLWANLSNPLSTSSLPAPPTPAA